MKAEQISTWIGIATAFAGVIASFVTMETKLEALEGKMAEIYNVEEIRSLEKRLTTLEVTQSNSDIGHIQATIATIEGNIKNVETKISGIKETDTSEIQSGSLGSSAMSPMPAMASSSPGADCTGTRS